MANHDIKIDLDSHEWVADVTFNEETMRWEIAISEDNDAYDGNNIDYTTREEALRAALGYIVMDAGTGNPYRIYLAISRSLPGYQDQIKAAEQESGGVPWYFQGDLSDGRTIYAQYFTDCVTKDDAVLVQKAAIARGWLVRLGDDNFGFRRVGK